MLECVILFRYANGRVDYVHDGEGDPPRMMVYPDRDAAIAASDLIPVCRALPFQIVELSQFSHFVIHLQVPRFSSPRTSDDGE